MSHQFLTKSKLHLVAISILILLLTSVSFAQEPEPVEPVVPIFTIPEAQVSPEEPQLVDPIVPGFEPINTVTSARDCNGWTLCQDIDGGLNSKHPLQETQIIYVNGICNNFEGHQDGVELIESYWDKPVLGIFNESLTWDSLTCIPIDVIFKQYPDFINVIASETKKVLNDANNNYENTENVAVKSLFVAIERLFEANPPNFELELIGHSQGAAVIATTLYVLENENGHYSNWDSYKDRIIVTTLGGASPSFPQDGPNYIHYFNYNQRPFLQQFLCDSLTFGFCRNYFADPVPRYGGALHRSQINNVTKEQIIGKNLYEFNTSMCKDVSSLFYHSLCQYVHVVDIPSPHLLRTEIQGYVLDRDGRGVESALIQIFQDNVLQSSTLTAFDGSYSIRNPPVGTVDIYASHNQLGKGLAITQISNSATNQANVVLNELDYSLLNPIDTVLVIDSSGSMTSNDPSNQRLAAAKAYLAVSLTTDFVGLIDFDSQIQNSVPLNSILTLSRENLRHSIDEIDSYGGTNIDLALNEACILLRQALSFNYRKSVILLTDGDHEGEFIGDLSCFTAKDWRIYTLGFGDSNNERLQSIANQTGGNFTYISDEDLTSLVCEFTRIRADISGNMAPSCTSNVISPNETITLESFVGSDQSQITFSLSWPGSDIEMSLISPYGRIINRNTVSEDIVHDLDDTFEVYTILNPVAGLWEINLYGADVDPAGEPYVFSNISIPKPPLPDLNVAIESKLDPAPVGYAFRYEIQVSNSGVQNASQVVLQNTLPDEVEILSATSSQGSCTFQDTVTNCQIGDMVVHGNAIVTIEVLPNSIGDLNTQAVVYSNQEDHEPSDNTAIETTNIEFSPVRVYPYNQINISSVNGWSRFSFLHQPNAEWYQIWIGTSDYRQTYLFNWYPATDQSAWAEQGQGICINETCTIPTDLWLTNGSYEWWITYWSPDEQDFNQYWNGTALRVDVDAPTDIIQDNPVETISSLSRIQWERDPNVLWYRVWLGPADYSRDLILEWFDVEDYWFRVEDICNPNKCSLPISDMAEGAYVWWMEAWGPGGYTDWYDNNVYEFTLSNNVNPPTAADFTVHVTSGQSITIELSQGASDPDGDGIANYAVTFQPIRGELSGNAPSVVYTPLTGYVGTDAFTYRVSDGALFSQQGTVTIIVDEAPIVVIPTNTPTSTVTSSPTFTLTPTSTHTPTLTFTPSSTPTTTPTYTPSPTNTPVDVAAPNGVWTTPLNGDISRADTLTLSVDATDNEGGTGVADVRFSAKWGDNWHAIGNVTEYPYTLNWNWCSDYVPRGDIELGMEVWDHGGNKWVYSEHYPNIHVAKNFICVQPIFGDDFEGTVGSEFSTFSTEVSPLAARKFLGRFYDEIVTLTLNNLPEHFALKIKFDLYIINSWDGHTSDVDTWQLSADGNILLNATFDNHDFLADHIQSYPNLYPGTDNAPRTGAEENNTLGYTMDAVYHLDYFIQHNQDQLTLEFNALQLEGGLDDESWGIDNLEISITECYTMSDYNELVVWFFSTVPPAPPTLDLNADGIIDISDYSVMISNWCPW